MEKQPTRNGVFIYDLFARENGTEIENMSKALASPVRLEMLRQLNDHPRSLAELCKLNGLSAAAILNHVNVLKRSKLCRLEFIPSGKGATMMVFLCFNRIEITSRSCDEVRQLSGTKLFRQSMPVGLFAEAERYSDYFRFALPDEKFDDVNTNIWNPKRTEAGLVFTDGGKIVYHFGNTYAKIAVPRSLTFSLELCSECPYWCSTWKSDITFSVNGRELLTYMSPGDFGDRKGKLNPDFWGAGRTQYGLLKQITVNDEGTSLDGVLVGKTTIGELALGEGDYTAFGIETKRDAVHYGGFNLFGKSFGDYPQDIEFDAFCDELPPDP